MGVGHLGILIVVVVALVAITALIGAVLLVRGSNKRIRDFANSSDLIPGRPGRAPAEWAQSTAPEAQLHQRVRYAIAAIHGRDNAAAPPPADSAARCDVADLAVLDDAVFDLDDRIIEAAGLTGDRKATALAELEPAVATLEGLNGQLWESRAAQRRELIAAAVAAIRR